MSMRFPGQRRPPGQRLTDPLGSAQPDLAVLPALTLVGEGGRHALRVLDGCAPFGAGCDELVTLLGDACAPADPLELRGEEEALAAFRAAHDRVVRHRLPVAGTNRRAAARRAARRAHRPPASTSGTAPLVGSALAVAASAAVMVLAYGSSLGIPRPIESGRGSGAGTVQGVLQPSAGSGGGGSVAAGPVTTSTTAPSGTVADVGQPSGRRESTLPSTVDSASAPVAASRLAAGESVRTAAASPSPSASKSPRSSPTRDRRAHVSAPGDPGGPNGSDAGTRLSGRSQDGASDGTSAETTRPTRTGRSGSSRGPRRADRSGEGSTDTSARSTDQRGPSTTRPKLSTGENGPSTTQRESAGGTLGSRAVPSRKPSGSTSPTDVPTLASTVAAGRVIVFGEALRPVLRGRCIAWKDGTSRPEDDRLLLFLAGDEETVTTVCADLLIRTR